MVLDPCNIAARLRRRQAYKALGRQREAEADLGVAVALKADNQAACLGLHRQLLKQGDFAVAGECLKYLQQKYSKEVR